MLMACIVGRLDDDYSLRLWEIESDFEMLMCWRQWRGMAIDLTFARPTAGDREMHDDSINVLDDVSVQMQVKRHLPEMFQSSKQNFKSIYGLSHENQSSFVSDSLSNIIKCKQTLLEIFMGSLLKFYSKILNHLNIETFAVESGQRSSVNVKVLKEL